MMNFGDLCKRVDELRAAGTSPATPVGVCGHYSELEDDFSGLRIVRKKGKVPFIALEGVSSKYPEPD